MQPLIARLAVQVPTGTDVPHAAASDAPGFILVDLQSRYSEKYPWAQFSQAGSSVHCLCQQCTQAGVPGQWSTAPGYQLASKAASRGSQLARHQRSAAHQAASSKPPEPAAPSPDLQAGQAKPLTGC